MFAIFITNDNLTESLFLFLAIFGKVVLLRSVRGKLMTRIN